MYHVVAVSLLLRVSILFLTNNDSNNSWLYDRIELSTPLNSWTRLKEGVALKKAGQSPYEGDLFHETPLSLLLFQILLPFGHVISGLVFIIIDLLIAYCLTQVARLHHHVQLQDQDDKKLKGELGKGVEPILIKYSETLPTTIASVYLLNPFSVLSCGAYSTIALNNLSIIFTIWMSLKKNWYLCGLGLSLAVYFSFYPIMLILPLSLLAYKYGSLRNVLQLLVYTVVWLSSIVYVSMIISGSWDYLSAVYGVILFVPDFTPNIGLFWYFFTEMFDHFQTFFLCVFQINAFIHALPLSIKFSNDPMFLIYILLSNIALFKSYPVLGDIILPLALLPLWSHTFRYFRFTIIIIGCIITCSTAGPILWYLWIHTGSANANFFFAISLTYSLTQVFLLLDIVHSYITHQYDMIHGLPRLIPHLKLL